GPVQIVIDCVDHLRATCPCDLHVNHGHRVSHDLVLRRIGAGVGRGTRGSTGACSGRCEEGHGSNSEDRPGPPLCTYSVIRQKLPNLAMPQPDSATPPPARGSKTHDTTYRSRSDTGDPPDRAGSSL